MVLQCERLPINVSLEGVAGPEDSLVVEVLADEHQPHREVIDSPGRNG
jgi:hypothetical protein